MSTRTPYATVFDVQRTAIEGSRAAAESGIALSRTATDALVEGLDATREAQKSGLELFQRTTHAYLDAVEESGVAGDVGGVREFVDEGFAATDEFHDEAWVAFERSLEEFEDSADELSDAQRELVADTFDAILEAQTAAEEATAEAAEAVEIDVDEG